MEKYGFPGLSAFDIVETGKVVREEIAANDPEKAASLWVSSVTNIFGIGVMIWFEDNMHLIQLFSNRTHTEIRELAIRREMEKIILERKLESTAEDWATQVSSLSPIVRKHAEK